MPGFQGKARGPVLKRDSGLRHHHPGTEPHVVRLDVAHHHAVAVRGTEIHRPASRGGARTVVARVPSDQRPARGEVAGVEHCVDRNVGDVRIGHKAIAVRKRELHRLDLPVPALGACVRRLVHGRARNDSERLQSRNPLPVRRDLPDLVIPIRDRDRLHPFRTERRQIAVVQHRARGSRAVRDARGQRALVEVPGSLRRHAAQRLRVPRTAPDLPCIGGSASEREHPCPLVESGISGAVEHGTGPAPQPRDDRRDREPALGEANRVGEQGRERRATEPLVAANPRRRVRRGRKRSPTRARGIPNGPPLATHPPTARAGQGRMHSDRAASRHPHTMANASLPIPFDVGSTTVRVIAVASAASSALPPALRTERPA